MKISGSYNVDLPREAAYELLQDPEVLAKSMPGCDRLDRIGEDEYAMKMKMAIASISGLFDGKVRLADQQPPEGFRLIVEGAGKVGFMKGEGLLRLSNQEAGTEIRYEGDVHVGGTLAAVGQRLLDTTSRMMIKRFFDKFAENAKQQA
ncbi:MAG: SRPBCC family protein [Bryobacteraceae bacterium]